MLSAFPLDFLNNWPWKKPVEILFTEMPFVMKVTALQHTPWSDFQMDPVFVVGQYILEKY